MMRLAVIMTCFNRAPTTEACLLSLQQAAAVLDVVVYLNDDGSTDNTASVARSFPFVRYLRGSGSMFWNGGMHHAWSRAAEEGGYDAYLWLNDDVELDADAIPRAVAALARHPGQIIVGATRGRDGSVTYSGFRRAGSPWNFALERLPLSSQPQPCDTFNGNFVLIPAGVMQRLGLNDPRFHHSMGDIDYGLRAAQAGVSRIVLPGSIGTCEANDKKKTSGWGSRQLPLARRWKIANTHLGLPWKSWLRFTRRHCGWRWPVVFARQYVYLLGLDLLRGRRT